MILLKKISSTSMLIKHQVSCWGWEAGYRDISCNNHQISTLQTWPPPTSPQTLLPQVDQFRVLSEALHYWNPEVKQVSRHSIFFISFSIVFRQNGREKYQLNSEESSQHTVSH